MECPECGQLNPEGVKKCVWCGAEMGEDESESVPAEDGRVCPVCGKVTPMVGNYCAWCHTKIANAPSAARALEDRRAADLDERERRLQEREQALKEAELAARERILREREKAARENARRSRWEEDEIDEDEEDEPSGEDYSQRIGGRGAMGIVFFVTLALFILYAVYVRGVVDIESIALLISSDSWISTLLFFVALVASFWGWVRPDFGDAVCLVVIYGLLFIGGMHFAIIPAVLSLYCAVRFKDFQDRTRAAKRSARRKKKRKLSRDQRRVLDSATDAELGRAYRRAIKNGGSVVVEFDEDEDEEEDEE